MEISILVGHNKKYMFHRKEMKNRIRKRIYNTKNLMILGDWVDGNRSGKGLYLFTETGNRYKGIFSTIVFFSLDCD